MNNGKLHWVSLFEHLTELILQQNYIMAQCNQNYLQALIQMRHTDDEVSTLDSKVLTNNHGVIKS